MSFDPGKVPSGDTGLAQLFYLANMYAQRNECQCIACQLLRKSTDGMIAQMLGKGVPGTQLDMAKIMKQMGVGEPAQVEDPAEV